MKLGNNLRRCRFDYNEMSQEDLANAVGLQGNRYILLKKENLFLQPFLP
jgi:DNA-binding XRE family transcriptional regulator